MTVKTFIYFCALGVVNTFADWGVYYLTGTCIPVSQPKYELIAKGIGCVAGIGCAFLTSSLLVFRAGFLRSLEDRPTLKEKLKYIIVTMLMVYTSYSLGMGANMVAFYILRTGGMSRLISLMAATAISMLMNFMAMRLVFNRGIKQ